MKTIMLKAQAEPANINAGYCHRGFVRMFSSSCQG